MPILRPQAARFHERRISSVTFTSAHLYTVIFTCGWAWPACWLIRPDFGLLQRSQKYEIPRLGRRWTAVPLDGPRCMGAQPYTPVIGWRTSLAIRPRCYEEVYAYVCRERSRSVKSKHTHCMDVLISSAVCRCRRRWAAVLRVASLVESIDRPLIWQVDRFSSTTPTPEYHKHTHTHPRITVLWCRHRTLQSRQHANQQLSNFVPIDHQILLLRLEITNYPLTGVDAWCGSHARDQCFSFGAEIKSWWAFQI